MATKKVKVEEKKTIPEKKVVVTEKKKATPKKKETVVAKKEVTPKPRAEEKPKVAPKPKPEKKKEPEPKVVLKVEKETTTISAPVPEFNPVPQTTIPEKFSIPGIPQRHVDIVRVAKQRVLENKKKQ